MESWSLSGAGRHIAEEHFSEMLCGKTQGLIFPLKQINAARRNRLIQRDQVNAGKLRRAEEHFAGNKPNAKIAADHGGNLVDSLNLHIRAKGETTAEEKPGIKIVRGGSCCQGRRWDTL